ncbi:unnamed protein product [Symbiodinium natans]|uniref:Uncharacterized protein n=1 Tax=Symbiodinium natans TaxID=878477 RepID=A0A812P8I0_9DINO|nr:unnamed protein product [Symbiodinium natans]
MDLSRMPRRGAEAKAAKAVAAKAKAKAEFMLGVVPAPALPDVVQRGGSGGSGGSQDDVSPFQSSNQSPALPVSPASQAVRPTRSRCSSMSQMRLVADQDLLRRATLIFASREDLPEDEEKCRAADCFMVIVSGFLQLFMGLLPGGWSKRRPISSLVIAVVLTATPWFISLYGMIVCSGMPQWSHVIHLMEQTSFLALLWGVSCSKGFRELVMVRMHEVQERLDSAMQSSMKWDFMPIFAAMAIWMLCYAAQLQMSLQVETSWSSWSGLLPMLPALPRAAWAYTLLRFNRFLILLVDCFAQSSARHMDEMNLVYEQWACIVAFAGQASRWTGTVYFHMSTFSFLGIFPPLTAVFLDAQHGYTEMLLPQLFASIAYGCLAAYVLHRAAAVSRQRDNAVACTNSIQWALSPSQRRDHDILVSYMARSDLGISMCGICVTPSLMLKLASILATAASFLVARLVSLPEDEKADIADQWDRFIQAFGA